MMKKTLMGALLFSIGLSCQIQSAFAVAPVIVGGFVAANTCNFDNLGLSQDEVCGDGYSGIQCNMTPPGAALTNVSVNLLTYSGCSVSSTNFSQNDEGTITLCIPNSELETCFVDTITTFITIVNVGGEQRLLPNLELRQIV